MSMIVALGTSMPTSMTVVATSTFSSPPAELPHDFIPLFGLEPAMHQANPELGPARGQGVYHRGCRPQVGPLRFLDDGKHHVGLTTLGTFTAHELQNALTLLAAPHCRPHGPATRRPLP